MLEEWAYRRSQVISALNELAGIAESLGAERLARRLRAEVIEKVLANRFLLLVVGEFNHGKSTLVNALLGAEILPVGVTPTTAAIHHLFHSETPGARIVSEAGVCREIDIAGIEALSLGRGTAQSSSRVEVGYPAPWLTEDLVLVDTPGVNDLSSVGEEITYGYLPRADGVLFVLDAAQPVKESERRFLETRLVEQFKHKIVFVVCKADIWDERERDEALIYIRDQIARVTSDPLVFPVSAKEALEGKGDGGVGELRRFVGRFLLERRGQIVLDNAVAEASRAVGILAHGLDARSRSRTLDAQELDRRIANLEGDLRLKEQEVAEWLERIRTETTRIKAHARTSLDSYCDDVARRLPALVEPVETEDVQQHLGGFLRHALEKWVRAETESIAVALESLSMEVQALLRRDAAEFAGDIRDASKIAESAGRVQTDRFVYDVGVFAVFSLGVGTLFANALLGSTLLAAAPILALWSRDKARVEVKRRAVELGVATLREAGASIAASIDQSVDRYTQELSAWVAARGRDLHEELVQILTRIREEGPRPSTTSVPSDDDRAAAMALSRVQERLTSISRAAGPR